MAKKKPFHDLPKEHKDAVWEIVKYLSRISNTSLPKNASLVRLWFEPVAIFYKQVHFDTQTCKEHYAKALREHHSQRLDFNSAKSLDWLLQVDPETQAFIDEKMDESREQLHAKYDAYVARQAERDRLHAIEMEAEQERQRHSYWQTAYALKEKDPLAFAEYVKRDDHWLKTLEKYMAENGLSWK